MNEMFLDGIGILAPGFPDWDQAAKVFRGETVFREEPVQRPVARLIPENERRRASDSIHLAVHVAEEAVNRSDADPRSLIGVFASFQGDLKVIDRLCRSLNAPGHPVSPTQFHNSVHNSPAAYWSISTRSRGSSTSLSGAEFSFATALLSAAANLENEKQGVVLVVYETATPKPYHEKLAIEFHCAIALVLMPFRTGNSLARLKLHFHSAGKSLPEGASDEAWRALIPRNPAAQPLSLLKPVAREEEATVYFDTLNHSLEVRTEPCR